MLRLSLLIAVFSSLLPAAGFSFNVLVRAGLNAGDWEIGMGLNSSGVPAVSADVSPYWLNGSPQRFEIGYDSTNSRAYTRIYNDAAGTTRLVNLTYNVPGAFVLPPAGIWTLPAASFYASASVRPNATGITVGNMSMATAAGVLNPVTLTGTNNGTTATRSTQPSAIVFQPLSGGDWVLSGTLTFSGLSFYAGVNGASRSQLQFGFTAQATDTPTPEPGSLALAALSLGALAARWRTRRL